MAGTQLTQTQREAPQAVGAHAASTNGGATTDTVTRTGRTELVALFVPLAGLGIASLSVAMASSLVSGLLGIGPAGTSSVGMPAFLAWPAAVLGTGWAVAALVVTFLAFRRGTLPRPELTAKVIAVAGALHLLTLLVGLWRVPTIARYFDVTVAGIVVLELAVLACLGWMRRENQQAPGRRPAARRAPSALLLLGALFAGAIVVAAITTTGLAGSTAGELAVPHSGHGGHSHTSPSGTLLQLQKSGHHH